MLVNKYMIVSKSMSAIANMAGPPQGVIFISSKRLTWRFCSWINLHKVIKVTNSGTTKPDLQLWTHYLDCSTSHCVPLTVLYLLRYM